MKAWVSYSSANVGVILSQINDLQLVFSQFLDQTPGYTNQVYMDPMKIVKVRETGYSSPLYLVPGNISG